MHPDIRPAIHPHYPIAEHPPPHLQHPQRHRHLSPIERGVPQQLMPHPIGPIRRHHVIVEAIDDQRPLLRRGKNESQRPRWIGHVRSFQ